MLRRTTTRTGRPATLAAVATIAAVALLAFAAPAAHAATSPPWLDALSGAWQRIAALWRLDGAPSSPTGPSAGLGAIQANDGAVIPPVGQPEPPVSNHGSEISPNG